MEENFNISNENSFENSNSEKAGISTEPEPMAYTENGKTENPAENTEAKTAETSASNTVYTSPANEFSAENSAERKPENSYHYHEEYPHYNYEKSHYVPAEPSNENGAKKYLPFILIAAIMCAITALLTFSIVKMTEKAPEKAQEKTEESRISEPEENAGNPGIGFDDEITRIDPEENPEEVPENPDAALPGENEENPIEETPEEEGNIENFVIGRAAGAAGGEMTIAEVAKDAMPSMVQVTNTSIQEYRDIFGQTARYDEVSAGSGIVIGENDKELLIVTNYHVIEGNDKLTLTFADGEAVEGYKKGSDQKMDVAIIAVKKENMKKETLKSVSIIRVASEDNVQIGESVVAIGNALGYGQSVSAGIISAKGRTLDGESGGVKLLQTDASINPGNSGGALLNMRGELIGINEAKYVDESVEGVSYAIPISEVYKLIEDMAAGKTHEKITGEDAAYLGIECVSMPESYTANGYPAGVYVSTVVRDSAADKAGIKEGDIITSIDGTALTSSDMLLEELSYHKAGDKIKVKVKRLENEKFSDKEMDVTLAKKEIPQITQGEQEYPDSDFNDWLGPDIFDFFR